MKRLHAALAVAGTLAVAACSGDPVATVALPSILTTAATSAARCSAPRRCTSSGDAGFSGPRAAASVSFNRMRSSTEGLGCCCLFSPEESVAWV